MSFFAKHPDDCDCAVHAFPELAGAITEDTAEVRMMKAFVNTIRAEKRLFDLTQGRQDAHYASSAFKDCGRQAWFQWMAMEPTNLGSSDDILDQGNDIEDQLVALYRDYGVFIGQRTYGAQQCIARIREPALKYPIHGKIDLFMIENDLFVPVEFKSTKDFGSDNRFCYNCHSRINGDSTAWHKFKPSASHVAQLTTYLHGYRGKTVAGRAVASYGKLHLRNRNSADDLRFRYEYVGEFYQKIIAYFEGMERLYEVATPPPVPKGFRKDRFPCAYTMGQEEVRCLFWDLCWKA